MERLWRLCLALGMALAIPTSNAGERGLTVGGEISIHDPSTIVECKGEYWVFGTGRGIVSRHSSDLVTWQAGPRVFTNPPCWTTNLVPGFRGHIWAPDVIRATEGYRLYYSISTWGSKTSAIGLTTNPTLDPAATNYGWTDRGVVIQSSPQESFNAIDPCVLGDRNGRMWLGLGSYWSGIKLVELDPATGKRLETNSTPAALAWKEAIEAASLYPHDGNYFLFVNWGQCCRGTNSTYEIRVGRSRDIQGPYFDKAGVNMLQGGGTAFLQTEGRFVGPGHASVLATRGVEMVSFHFYDGENHGVPTLALRKLVWDSDGWPQTINVASQALK